MHSRRSSHHPNLQYVASSKKDYAYDQSKIIKPFSKDLFSINIGRDPEGNKGLLALNGQVAGDNRKTE